MFWILFIFSLESKSTGHSANCLQHATSKLACIALCATRSCLSSICPGSLSTAWLVYLVVFPCHHIMISTQGLSVVFETVDMQCPGQLPFSYIVDYVYDLCLLSDPDVGLSRVCDVEHTSFHLDRADVRLFCACLVSVQVSAPYGSRVYRFISPIQSF